MKMHKYSISNSLTSFNSHAAGADTFPAGKTPGKVHRLPPTIWKKMVGDAQNPLDRAIERTRDFFFREQLPDGYWWAELESNVTITSEYIMLFHFLGMVDRLRERKMTNSIVGRDTGTGAPAAPTIMAWRDRLVSGLARRREQAERRCPPPSGSAVATRF
jgi:squalene-hopene/tetraprenyl-beta-curcumene cyclase